MKILQRPSYYYVKTGNLLYNQKRLDTIFHHIITDILTCDLIDINIFPRDLVNIAMIKFGVRSYTIQYVDIERHLIR